VLGVARICRATPISLFFKTPWRSSHEAPLML
jgi:hypothetical protein